MNCDRISIIEQKNIYLAVKFAHSTSSFFVFVLIFAIKVSYFNISWCQYALKSSIVKIMNVSSLVSVKLNFVKSVK